MKKKLDREMTHIRDISKKLSQAIRTNDKRKASDLNIELGEIYRRNESFEKAIEYYNNAGKLSEINALYENATYAYRALAELSVEHGDNQKAFYFANKYIQMVRKTNECHLIQLAYHVMGWLHLQAFLNSKQKANILLEKGRDWCEKGLVYLKKNANAIDSNSNAVKIAEDSRARKARLRQLLSQIYDKLNMKTVALQHHNAALAYAVRANDLDLQYRCILSKLNFIGDQRLKTAIELIHVATNLDAKALAESKFILAQEKIRAKDFDGAKWDLINFLSTKSCEKLVEEEYDVFEKTLIVAYKTVERLKKVLDMDDYKKMRIYDKIADDFLEIDFTEISLYFYKETLRYAKTTNDKINALVSIAETAKESDRLSEAYECFLKVDELESHLNINQKKRAETKICIMNVVTKMKALSSDEILELFLQTESMMVSKKQKINFYEIFLEFLMEEKNDEENERIREIQSKLLVLKNDEDDETYSDEEEGVNDEGHINEIDEIDELTDLEVIARCRIEGNNRSEMERWKLEKDKRINSYGETRMHEAARANDPNYLKSLIRLGYNVNAIDEGGWTPLHEAVGALKLDNVRILLRNGVSINSRSNEGTITTEGERTDSGGLTPLMEACDRGSLAIASLLLGHGADITLRNHDNWTALDFLRNAIKMGMVDDEDMDESNKLVALMENKLREAKVKVNFEPPPKRKSLNVSSDTKSARCLNRILEPTAFGVEDYRRTMTKVGRNAVHNRKESSMTDLFYGFQDNLRTDIFPNDYDDSIEELLNLDDGLNDFTQADSSSKEAVESGIFLRKGTKQEPTSSSRLRRKRQRFALGTSNDKKIRRMCWDDQKQSSESEDEIILGGDSSSHANDPTLVQKSIEDYIEANTSTFKPEIPNRMVNTITKVISEKNCDVQPITTERQSQYIFARINFKNDNGITFKTKGIAFMRSSLVKDIRNRCMDELKSDCEFEDFSIFFDDCELADDIPIELIFTQNEVTITCHVKGIKELSPSNVYEKKSSVVMWNVKEALQQARYGTLNLSEMHIGDSVAVIDAIKTFTLDELSEVFLNGNHLSWDFIEMLSKRIRFITHLALSCCSLNWKNIRQLLGDRTLCENLKSLNIGFNDLCCINERNYLCDLVRLCPNIVELEVPYCNISENMMSEFVATIKSLTSLEVLDLSQNQCVNSLHVSSILETNNKLKRLYLDATDVEKIQLETSTSKSLELISLSMCDLCDDPLVVFSGLLNSCPCLSTINLSLSPVNMDTISMICRSKSVKQPVLELVLIGCTTIESEPDAFVDFICSNLSFDSAVKFELDSKFRDEMRSKLSNSFNFCLK